MKQTNKKHSKLFLRIAWALVIIFAILTGYLHELFKAQKKAVLKLEKKYLECQELQKPNEPKLVI